MSIHTREIVIAVDFDGTIVKHEFPEVGEPVPEAIDWLLKWLSLDAKLILYTMRSGEHLVAAVEYLETAGVGLWGVNRNPNQHDWTESPKAYAQIYVDDAAFGCPLIKPEVGRAYVDWTVVGPVIASQLAIARSKGDT